MFSLLLLFLFSSTHTALPPSHSLEGEQNDHQWQEASSEKQQLEPLHTQEETVGLILVLRLRSQVLGLGPWALGLGSLYEYPLLLNYDGLIRYVFHFRLPSLFL